MLLGTLLLSPLYSSPYRQGQAGEFALRSALSWSPEHCHQTGDRINAPPAGLVLPALAPVPARLPSSCSRERLAPDRSSSLSGLPQPLSLSHDGRTRTCSGLSQRSISLVSDLRQNEDPGTYQSLPASAQEPLPLKADLAIATTCWRRQHHGCLCRRGASCGGYVCINKEGRMPSPVPTRAKRELRSAVSRTSSGSVRDHSYLHRALAADGKYAIGKESGQ